MDVGAELRVEIAMLRARIDTLQEDLRDLIALHRETLQALEHLLGRAPLPGERLQPNR
jgi:outer membrane protein TolC